jgi:hypothetical protein
MLTPKPNANQVIDSMLDVRVGTARLRVQQGSGSVMLELRTVQVRVQQGSGSVMLELRTV